MTKVHFPKARHPRVVANTGKQGARIRLVGPANPKNFQVFLKRTGEQKRVCYDVFIFGQPWSCDIVLPGGFQILTSAEVTAFTKLF